MDRKPLEPLRRCLGAVTAALVLLSLAGPAAGESAGAEEPLAGSTPAAAPAAGPPPWARSIATDRREYPTGIAVGADGSSYLTGFFLGGLDGAPGEARLPTAGDSDVLLVKLGPDGTTLWTRRFGAESADEGRAVAVGADGDVYVTGFFSGRVDFDPGPGRAELESAGSADVFVARLTSEGELVWARRAGGPLGDTSHGLAVDATGRVHVAGYFQGEADFDPGEGEAKLASVGGLDAFWLRLDSGGGYLGAGRFGGKSADEARAIAATGDGGAVVCGVFRGSAGVAGEAPWTSRGGTDVFVVGIDAAGEPRRLLRLGGRRADDCGGIATDGAGGVAAVGRFSGEASVGEEERQTRLTSAGASDAFVLSLDRDGQLRWARALGAAGSDFGFGLAVAADGSLWAAGFSNPVLGTTAGGGETRSFVARLAARGGETLVSHRLEARAGIQLLALGLGPGGAPHVAGAFGGEAVVRLPGGERRLPGAGKIDIAVARLSPEPDPTEEP